MIAVIASHVELLDRSADDPVAKRHIEFIKVAIRNAAALLNLLGRDPDD